MGSDSGINGIGVGVIALGLVVSWAGLRNQSVLTAFKSLAMGQMPQPNPKSPWSDVEFTPGPNPLTTTPQGSGGGATGNRIVDIAASFKGQPYCFGGGHGKACSSRCTDCSSYVSCVLNKAGVMKGTMTTHGFAKWGVSVPFAQRAAGDIVVWNGGPGGGHMGIVIDATRMWHNACTGCGGVQVGKYGSTRTGRPTIVRRAAVST